MNGYRFPASARVLLLQVRKKKAVQAHEHGCVVTQLGADPAQVASHNVLFEKVPTVARASAFDLVILGGAADHSVCNGDEDGQDGGDDPVLPLLELAGGLFERHRPYFGFCYGHQLLGRAFGGRVETVHPDEVGTWDVELTPKGVLDPVFAGLPRSFPAQLGHHDAITELPAGLVSLASSPRCRHQAVRVPDQPIYGTQFHPELTMDDMAKRLSDSPDYRLEKPLRPSPEANEVLARFARAYLR